MRRVIVFLLTLELASARLYTPPPLYQQNRFIHKYRGFDRVWLVIAMHLIFGALCFFASYAVEYRRMQLGDGEIVGLVPRFPIEWDNPLAVV